MLCSSLQARSSHVAGPGMVPRGQQPMFHCVDCKKKVLFHIQQICNRSQGSTTTVPHHTTAEAGTPPLPPSRTPLKFYPRVFHLKYSPSIECPPSRFEFTPEPLQWQVPLGISRNCEDEMRTLSFFRYVGWILPHSPFRFIFEFIFHPN